MRIRLLTLFYVFIICTGNFVAAQTTFQKTIGGTGSDYGFSCGVTSDGGYIISGVTVDFVGSSTYYAYLIKLDANGDTLWVRKMRTTTNDRSTYVEQTTDGGFILTGGTSGGVFLNRTDVDGNSLWIKSFSSGAPMQANCVKQTTDGGYVMVGYLFSFISNDYDVYLIKTDSAGIVSWTKSFGGLNADKGNWVQQTADGGYIIVGETESFGLTKLNVYLIKTDINGDTLWTKTLGGINDDQGNAIEQTTDGGYIITGNSGSFGAGDWDVYLIKVDDNGNPTWSKTYGGASTDKSYSVHQTIDGGLIVSGATASFGSGSYDLFLIKTDAIGDTLWTKTFGGVSGEQTSIAQQTSDGGYFVLGSTSSFGAGGADVYAIKTDSSGISGCHEGNPSTVVASPSTQQTSPSTQFYANTITDSTTSLIFGSVSIVNTLCLTIDMNESITDNLFTVFPNPTSGNFRISFQKMMQQCSVEVINSLGLIVFSDIVSSASTKEIDLKKVSDGLYYVKVIDGMNYYCKKILVANY